MEAGTHTTDHCDFTRIAILNFLFSFLRSLEAEAPVAQPFHLSYKLLQGNYLIKQNSELIKIICYILIIDCIHSNSCCGVSSSQAK